MNTAKAGTGRLPLIEYLRGLAALAVAWFHMTNQYADRSWVRASGSFGWLGVEVFFVISGFVIPLSIASSYSSYSAALFPRFLTRRLLRLEPPYLLSVALTLILWKVSSLVPGFRGTPPAWETGQALAHLLYLVPLTNYGWFQPVYWSLAWEFVFYISMGLLFTTLGRRERSTSWYLIATVLIGAVALGSLSELTLLFVIGIAVYRATLFEREHPHRWASGFIVLAAASAIARSNPYIAGAGLATGAAIHFYKRLAFEGPLHRSLMALGGLSYSLYLIHVPIGGRMVNIGRRFMQGSAAELILSLTALGGALTCAWMFHRFVEVPSVSFARRATAPSRPR